MSDELDSSTFTPQLGTTFMVCADGYEPIPLTLAAVEKADADPDGPRSNPFTLEFTGPAGYAFVQQIYPLEHPVLGRLDIFLVPIQPADDGLPRLEAVFN